MSALNSCCLSDVQSKAIEVTVEEPKAQTVRVGSTVSFICTAKSKVAWGRGYTAATHRTPFYWFNGTFRLSECCGDHMVPSIFVSPQSPAYTLVWTRMGNRKLPNRAMDFNGILTIQNVQPEDAGVYVCTGSNMLAMDEGNAILYVPGS